MVCNMGEEEHKVITEEALEMGKHVYHIAEVKCIPMNLQAGVLRKVMKPERAPNVSQWLDIICTHTSHIIPTPSGTADIVLLWH